MPTFGLEISRKDLDLFRRLKAQPKKISDVIRTFNKRKKSASNSQAGSDGEGLDEVRNNEGKRRLPPGIFRTRRSLHATSMFKLTKPQHEAFA